MAESFSPIQIYDQRWPDIPHLAAPSVELTFIKWVFPQIRIIIVMYKCILIFFIFQFTAIQMVLLHTLCF